jgi:hypothetical protein
MGCIERRRQGDGAQVLVHLDLDHIGGLSDFPLGRPGKPSSQGWWLDLPASAPGRRDHLDAVGLRENAINPR